MVKGPVGPSGKGFWKGLGGIPGKLICGWNGLLTQMFTTPAVRSLDYLRYLPESGMLP